MSPELKSIILCSMPKKNLELPQEQIDYKKLIGLSIHHRAYSSLYYCLKHSANTKIAPEILEELQKIHAGSQDEILILTNELKQLAIIFKEHNIPFVSLKGPLLSKMLYGDIAMRPTRDLDLWVALEDVELATQLLLARGYQNNFPTANTSKKLSYCAKNGHHLTFTHKRNNILVELHTSRNEFFLENDNKLPPTGMVFDRINFDGIEFLTLKKEDLLLYLCMHASYHHYRRLRWLADIVLLINQNESNWNWKNIFLQARKTKMERVLALGLVLANHYYQLTLPTLTPMPKIKKLVTCCIEEIDTGNDVDESHAAGLKTRHYFSMLSRSWRYKYMIWLQPFTNLTRAFGIIDLPDRYFFGYYLLIPILLGYRAFKLVQAACSIVSSKQCHQN